MHVSINTAVFLSDVQAGSSQYDCLKKLTDSPIDNIEVRGELFDKATKETELEKIDDLCQKNNWKFFYSIPEQLFETDKINANLKEYLKMAAKHNIDHLKISLGDLSEVSDEQFTELKELLDQYSDVKVTIENQPNENGTLTTFTQQHSILKDKKMPLGYTFDSGNWYWVYEDPSDAFKNLSKEINVFHLKDIKNKETVLLDEGATDWKDLVNNLATDIPVFLEYEISQDDLSGQIKKVNDVLETRDK